MGDQDAAKIPEVNGVSNSRMKDLLKFLSTIKGDLANITAPPSFLAPCSVVENPRCLAERPDVFVAPTLEESSAKRSLLVLRMFLIGLRRQLYIGGGPGTSIRKPLNAFLGEVHLSSWASILDGQETARTKLVSEQVSHHPPITAMHIASDTHGIRADGYARVEMKFSTTLKISQIGHTILHIDRFDEDYLLPLPDVQVRGFLSACLYPEIWGTYFIPSTSGYVAELRFSGGGLLSGQSNKFEGKIHHTEDKTKAPVYTVEGIWSQGWIVKESSTGQVLEVYDVEDADANLNSRQDDKSRDIEQQDEWESSKAWHQVLYSIQQGDLEAVSKAKNALEQAQRRMRREEKAKGKEWQPLLFSNDFSPDDYEVFHILGKKGKESLDAEQTLGVWKINDNILMGLQKPFRPGVTPLGYT